MTLFLLVLESGPVSFNPDPTKIPGSGSFADLVNGFGALALIACLLGLVLSGAVLGIGHAGGNLRAAETGKVGLIASCVGALLIGGSAVIINFFFGTGHALH